MGSLRKLVKPTTPFKKSWSNPPHLSHLKVKMKTSLLYIAVNLALASAQVQQILEAISTAQEFAPQAIQYAQEYGPQAISAWQNYGPQAIQYAQEYGPQAIQYAQNYGPQAIQYAQEYGPQAIQAWQQYGNQLPEAISFAQQNAQYIP